MDVVWTIYLLGQMRAQQGARSIQRFRTQRARALLAYLAYYLGRAHNREILIDMLWPDYTLERGQNCLSIELSWLRNQLEPPGVSKGAVICADRYTIQLNPESVKTDTGELTGCLDRAIQSTSADEQIGLFSRAADLYCDRLLPGLYEEWIPLEQMALESRLYLAIQQLCTLLVRSGDAERAVHYAQVGWRMAPPHSEAHCGVMDLLPGQPDMLSAAGRQHMWRDAELEEQRRPPRSQMRLPVESSWMAVAAASDVIPTASPRHLSASMGLITMTLLYVYSKAGHPTAATAAENHGVLPVEGARGAMGDLLHRHHGMLWVAGPHALLAFPCAAVALTATRSLLQSRAASRTYLKSAQTPQQELPAMILHTVEVDPSSKLHPSAVRLLESIGMAAMSGAILCTEATAALLKHQLPPDVRLLPLGDYQPGNGDPKEPLFGIATEEGLRSSFLSSDIDISDFDTPSFSPGMQPKTMCLGSELKEF
jgi:DNA-binding SARP family transcriptional activator